MSGQAVFPSRAKKKSFTDTVKDFFSNALFAEALFFFAALEPFYVYGVYLGNAFFHRRFREILAAAQFFQDTGSFVFAFEFFEGAFDIFSLFYGHDNHSSKFFK